MSVVRNPLMNPWKDASRYISGEDAAVVAYIKCIADEGLTSGNAANSATLTDATDLITFQIAEAGGSLANDTGIDYTSNSGSAGTITVGDTNMNTPQKLVNIVNGVGVGQTAFRRWRAAIGDVYPTITISTGDTLDLGATQAMLGRSSVGLELNWDLSNGAVNAMHAGIGTQQGTIEGAGSFFPDYFEDIPGSSTTASVNTPVRSSAVVPRKASEAITARKQYRITGWSAGAVLTTSTLFTVRDVDGNVIFQTPFTSGAVVNFQDYSDAPILGPVGSPLFASIQATTYTTAGSFFVRAEERFV